MTPFSEAERAAAAVLLAKALGPEVMKLAETPGVEDIAINPPVTGSSGSVAFCYTGRGKFRLETVYDPAMVAHIVNIAARFAGEFTGSGGMMSFSSHLPGNVRFQGGIEPRSIGGPYAVLRFLPKVVRSFDDYVADGVAPIDGKLTGLYDMDADDVQEQVGVGLPTMQCIEAAIRERLTIVVFGETGSGKSSLLMSMLNHPLVQPDRVVTLEDTPEIQLPYVMDRLQLSSAGVDMGELLKDSLRCRPDRVVVGEARDGAIWVFVMAQYTGHAGGFVTMHASNPRDFFDRVDQMVAQAGVDPSTQRRVIAKTLQRIVWIKRRPGGGRDIVGVYRPAGYTPEKGYRLERIDIPHQR